MPLGRPDADGDLVHGSRHYRGNHGTVGVPLTWVCPACAKTNESRRIEQGCMFCGSGDPAKNKAGDRVGRVQLPPGDQAPENPRGTGESGVAPRPGPMRPVTPRQVEALTRVYRLLEYIIQPGRDVDVLLRNSLVGRIEFEWGTLTGTIVDSLDAQQEDRLSMARRQPGVWLANQDAMKHSTPRSQQPQGRPVLKLSPKEAAEIQRYYEEKPMEPELPDTGPSYSADDTAFAQAVVEALDWKGAYTLAMGLQAIANEADLDPRHFLTAQACLALAAALMAQLPADWQQEQEVHDGQSDHGEPEARDPVPPARAGERPSAEARGDQPGDRGLRRKDLGPDPTLR